MAESIEIHIDHAGETRLVGRCRHAAGRSSIFEYAEAWLSCGNG